MSEPSQRRVDLRLVGSARARGSDLLEPVRWPPLPDPSIQQLVVLSQRAPGAHSVTVSGGEPTTRADLPALLAALSSAGAPRLGLATDGLALISEPVVRPLVDSGLQRIRLPLHCGSSDAHDWLVGRPGAAARVRRAIRVCRAVGLRVELEATVTRPTLALLPEAIEVFAALGAQRVHLRWLRLGPANHAHAVALAPRLGQLPPILEAVVRRGRGLGMPVALRGFPACAVPPGLEASDAEAWAVPGGSAWAPVAAALAASGRSCDPGCPQPCPGIDEGYVAVFGWGEPNARGSAGEPPEPTLRPGEPIPAPLPRGGWRPAIDVRTALARARTGRPLRRPAPGAPVDVLEVALDPEASTRLARRRLLWAAAERPGRLRLLGGWIVHPQGLALLREAELLHLDVEVVGPAGGLSERSEAQLTSLAHLARVIVSIEAGGAPGAGAWVQRLVAAGVSAELSGRIDGVRAARRLLEAWAHELLPGTPRLHLADGTDGAVLRRLVEVDHPAVRALLPTCLGGLDARRWARLDERGRLIRRACPCGDPTCQRQPRQEARQPQQGEPS